MGLECDVRITHDRSCSLLGELGIHSAPFVETCQFLALAFRPLVDGVALDGQLTFEELLLGTHRDVLAGGHGERPADQHCETGQADHPLCRMRTSHAEDERHIGHEPIAYTEHCRSRSTAVNVPMPMIFHSRSLPVPHRCLVLCRPATPHVEQAATIGKCTRDAGSTPPSHRRCR